MPSILARATREIYRRELIPARARWWLAAAGMRDWYRTLASGLKPHLGDRSRALLADLSVRLFERRWDALRAARPSLPDRARDRRALALAMGALYRVEGAPRAAWIFDGLGGPARGPIERARAAMLLRSWSAAERWEEVTTHLGELLIVLTEDLPAHLPHARKILADICFASGARFAKHARRMLGLRDGEASAPALTIEVLRMSEYVFRVNPEHRSHAGADGTGWLEGNACPWFTRPGWHAAHCGIFGQFQSGIASEFGLRYHLDRTIPKHGGDVCKIDLAPIPLRRSAEGGAIR
jgi:hypothetical protein